MASPSKKRTRTSDEDVADDHDAKAVKKSKLDRTGKAAASKKSAKVNEGELEPIVVKEVPNTKKGKKEKKEKKRKSKDVYIAVEPENEPAAPSAAELASESAAAAAADGDSTIAGKKSRKKKSKKDKQNKPTEPSPTTEDQTLSDPTSTSGAGSKQTRFICFVGNLPYTATAASVQAHFASLQPASVRLLTQRDNPSKSRGIAFVEFDRYDHMKTCLEKFHHTEFDDGMSPARRINVELTYVFLSISSLPVSNIRNLKRPPLPHL